MAKKKGNDVAGGGLAARTAAYDRDTPTGWIRNGNGNMNVRVHRPGSQNFRKGGRGRTI